MDYNFLIIENKPSYLLSLFRSKIRIGVYDLSRDDGNVLEIVNSFVHPNYDGKTSYFDIAVLETENINFSKRVIPVCLPDKISYDVDKYDDNEAQLAGWGSHAINENTSKILKRVSVRVYSQRYGNLYAFYFKFNK